MHQLLCKPKVYQFEMAVGIDEHVLGLHISVGNVLVLVKELEDEDHFRNIEACGFLVEPCCASEVCEDFAARAIVQLLAGQRHRDEPNGGLRTSMYRQSLSEKLVIIVVMNGWPATAARVLRSFLMCSICFNRMTARHGLMDEFDLDVGYTHGSLSVLRRIFSAKTFWPSLGASARHASQTLAKVPNSPALAACTLSRPPGAWSKRTFFFLQGRSEHTGANRLEQVKVADPEVLAGRANFLATRRGRDLAG